MKRIVEMIIGIVLLNTIFVPLMASNKVAAVSCRDIEFVFARGSGAVRNSSSE